MAKAMRREMLALVFMAGEASAQFCPGLPPWVFDDVPISHPFCTDITWIAQRGVTLGCAMIDPNHRLYCPNANVNRGEMAAFMHRLGDVTFQQGGNAFGAAGELGTTDNQALEIIVNNSRVMRYEPNAISPNVIGGSPANNVTAGVRGATIAGGGVPSGDTDPNFGSEGPNRVTDVYGTVGGGYANRAGDGAGTTTDQPFATVGGGVLNTASGTSSTVAGGERNTASGHYSTVAGGAINTASISDSTVAGGFNNTASGDGSTVAGGVFNTASGHWSTVAGGPGNTASGSYSTVAGGQGNTASGIYSIVAGGQSNTASGFASFAAGRRANANADGCFVWGDNSTTNEVTCGAANIFVVRSLGGAYFFSAGDTDATYSGVVLLPGATAWVALSDRRLKENVHTVDTRDVLDRLLALPITTWNLKTQDPSIRHMGAMAQDFRAAFGLGETELGISTLDADGVALAAIQGLNAKLQRAVDDRDATIAELKAALAAVVTRLDELEARQRR